MLWWCEKKHIYIQIYSSNEMAHSVRLLCYLILGKVKMHTHTHIKCTTHQHVYSAFLRACCKNLGYGICPKTMHILAAAAAPPTTPLSWVKLSNFVYGSCFSYIMQHALHMYCTIHSLLYAMSVKIILC